MLEWLPLEQLRGGLQCTPMDRNCPSTNWYCLVFLTQIQGGHKPGKPEILRDFSMHGKLREFSGNSVNSVQPHGKIVTNKVFLLCHSNIYVKQLLTE